MSAADQRERDAIRDDLDVTMLVEAAAGTGKTTSLVARIVNLVRTGRATPAALAAITFTVKAAAQLRERVQEGLERADLRDALESIDRGFIGTTHAFCARLLRERPVEAGLDPEFEELDEGEARRLTAEFWTRWYEAQVLAGHPRITEAQELELDRWILRAGFEKVVEYPDVDMISSRAPRPDLRAACDELARILDACRPHLPTDAHREAPDGFETLIVALLRRREASDFHDLPAQLAFLREANHASQKPVQKRWPDGPTAKQLGVRYSDFVRNMLRPMLQQWTEHVHSVAMDVLLEAARAFESERRRNGTLTYQDLLTCARDLLRDHPEVRRYFQRRFPRVLVDEFQDTDPLQAEILFYLTGEDVEERDWRALRPRAGSLFIVGDPKQSIYRFRRADISTYLEVRARIEASGGRIVQLSTNFRSTPSVCAFVNETFEPMFGGDDVDAGRQAPHVALSPARTPPAVHGVFALETQAANRDVMAAEEARCLARWIRRAVDSGMRVMGDDGESALRWADILLVSAQRRRLSFYTAALETLGIPYEITGSRAFQESSALEDAMTLLRAIADPEDVVALTGFLRGPLCGVDDDALFRFVRAGGALSPFRDFPEGTDAILERGLTVVRDAIRDAERHPPAAALGRLFDRIGLTARAASGERGGTASGNLLLALSIARDESARGASFASIVDRFADLLENPPDIGELDVDPARSNAVRLMNLHQVKGLEAPVVFLIDPSDPWEFPIDLHVDRTGGASRGYLAVTRPGRPPLEIGLPLDWASMQRAERAFRDAERRRLLYVAATRARDLLVVGFHRTSGGVQGAWRELAGRIKDALFEVPESSSPETLVTSQVLAFEDEMRAIEARAGQARRGSYSVLPVTKIARASHAELVRAEEGLGRGTSWGRVLHRLFEAMLRFEEDRFDAGFYAANLLKDEERDAVELAQVMLVAESVQRSPLWQRVKRADARYVEVPFALNVARRSVGLDEDGETLLHGTIDLVFREGGEWFVVDYKSDSTEGRLETLTAYYAPQVAHYARFWAELTGEPARGGLFFVDGCIERWLPVHCPP